MSEFDPRGGQQFSKMSEIQKSLKFPMGGGSSLFGNFSQIFPFYFYDGSPKMISFSSLPNKHKVLTIITEIKTMDHRNLLPANLAFAYKLIITQLD